jgi:L,D-transpeptidase YnhG
VLPVRALLPIANFLLRMIRHVFRVLITAVVSAMLLGAAASQVAVAPVNMAAARVKTVATPPLQKPAGAAKTPGTAEHRLIEIYRLVGREQRREALLKATALVQDHPNFQLAHLVYGDLLLAQSRPLRALGDVPDTMVQAGAPALADLREESRQRVKALRERPPAGSIPSQFLMLSPRNRHAIAVDTSRSRLYLFENAAAGPVLVADYYISVGKAGTEKASEGDARTPLGVYFITGSVNPKSLKDLYGSGALPINYPNMLDAKRGKTGGGIWLHGTPAGQFSRAPLSTDGCVALANPDLDEIVRTVEIRTTPVVISTQLQWVAPQSVRARSKPFEDTLYAWHSAKTSGDLERVLGFYTPDFTSYGKTLAEWTPTLRDEVKKFKGRPVALKDVSLLQWSDSAETMVVTFGEVPEGATNGQIKRQYWVREGAQWRIFFEGVIG